MAVRGLKESYRNENNKIEIKLDIINNIRFTSLCPLTLVLRVIENYFSLKVFCLQPKTSYFAMI